MSLIEDFSGIDVDDDFAYVFDLGFHRNLLSTMTRNLVGDVQLQRFQYSDHPVTVSTT